MALNEVDTHASPTPSDTPVSSRPLPVQPDPPDAAHSHFGFLLLPDFSMIAFVNAVEALRMANYVSRRPLYRWSVLTPDGAPATGSNGLPITPTASLDDTPAMETLFVCGGIEVRRHVNGALIRALTRLARLGMTLGSLCTGSYALVKAGLMNGYRCAVHWENLSSLREEFSAVTFTEDLFVTDRDRITCSGGTAPLYLMLDLMARRYGDAVAAGVSEQFILDRIRSATEKQHIPMAARIGVNRRELVSTAQLMEAHIEDPLSFDQIAESVGLSQRQLQRMFKEYLNISPTRYYLWLRLRRARELLLQTDMSVMSVTVACGFQSPCHFSKAYRSQFGHPPNSERRRAGLTRRAPASAHAVTPPAARRADRSRIFVARRHRTRHTPGRIVQGNQRHAHHVGDPQAVPEDGLHQGPVVLRHRRLTGVEAMGLGPAQSEAHRQAAAPRGSAAPGSSVT